MWSKLWLECDSKLVLEAFKNCSLGRFRVDGIDVLLYLLMHFPLSHIFLEGNQCVVNKLANYGVDHIFEMTW